MGRPQEASPADRPSEWGGRVSCSGRTSDAWIGEASLFEVLSPRPGERILDLGCGTGAIAARIAEAGAEVIGIDRSGDRIEVARRRHPHLSFEVGDARDFAFEGPFDAVFSDAVMHWVKEPGRAIRCIRRALKPGGRFLFESGGRGGVRAIVAALQDAARAVDCGEWEPPWHFPSLAEYAALLEREGFELTYAARFDRPSPLGGEAGLWRWVESFDDLMGRVPGDRRAAFLRHVEQGLRPALFVDGSWRTDYVRLLRIVARA